MGKELTNRHNIVGSLINKNTDESEYSSTLVNATFKVNISYGSTELGLIKSNGTLRVLNGSIEVIKNKAEKYKVTGRAEEIAELENGIIKVNEAVYNREVKEANENNEIYNKFKEKANNLILIGRDLA